MCLVCTVHQTPSRACVESGGARLFLSLVTEEHVLTV